MWFSYLQPMDLFTHWVQDQDMEGHCYGWHLQIPSLNVFLSKIEAVEMEAAVCAAIQENKLHSDQVHMVQIQASDKVSNR